MQEDASKCNEEKPAVEDNLLGWGRLPAMGQNQHQV